MKIIVEAYVNGDVQTCTNCHWKSSIYDEPFHLCPLCFHGLDIEIDEDHPSRAYGYSTTEEAINRAYRLMFRKRKDDTDE